MFFHGEGIGESGDSSVVHSSAAAVASIGTVVGIVQQPKELSTDSFALVLPLPLQKAGTTSRESLSNKSSARMLTTYLEAS